MYKLPYEPMSPERKQFVHYLMMTAAKAIDACRGHYSRVKFRGELMKRLDDTDPVVFGIPIPPPTIEAVRACKNIEWEVVKAYSRLVHLVLKKWTLRGECVSYTDTEDIRQEGLCALIDAMYSFQGVHKGQKVNFITFAYKVMSRRMGKAVNATIVDHLRRPSYIQDLMAKYDRVKQTLGPASPSEVMDTMGLTPVQRIKMARASLRVIIDEESKRGSLISASLLIHAKETERLEPDEKQSLVNIMGQLSPFERAVLVGCISGGYGWQAEVASQFVNPKTQKPYSRRAPHVTLEKIRKLVRATG